MLSGGGAGTAVGTDEGEGEPVMTEEAGTGGMGDV